MGRHCPHGITPRRWKQQKQAGFKVGGASVKMKRSPDSPPASPPSPAITRQKAKMLLQESEKKKYMLCQLGATEKLWNTAYREHTELYPQCKKMDLKQKTTDKALLSITAALYCTHCSFTSTPHKLYQVQPKSGPGRKQSTLNLAAGAALIKSPIGGTVFQEITWTLGLDPGSYSGLQKNINKANDMFVEIGEENRSSIRKKISDSGKPVRASGDARYCSPQSSSSNAPFERATQSTFNLTEETTGKVIGLDNQNKLCTQATRLRHQGQKVICPDHEGVCTATLAMTDSIGNEGRSFRKIADVLKKDGIDISHYTSDGDASMKKALHETFASAVWLKDSHHFQQAHLLELKKMKLSETMFSPEPTKSRRDEAKKRFCEDLSIRCSSELTAAVNEVTAITMDDSEIKKQLNSMLHDTPTAIIKCYQNDCRLCPEHSIICSGADDGKRWQASLMTEATCRNLKMTPEDEDILRTGILVRLGPGGVENTYLNTNSQLNEAVNRTVSKCLPKSITSPRNLEGRANAAVTTVNEGPGGCAVLCLQKIGHEVSETITKKLKHHDKRIQLRSDYRKRPDVKKRRVTDRNQKYQLHDQVRRHRSQLQMDSEIEITYKKRCSIFST